MKILEFSVQIIILPRLVFARRDSSVYNPACDIVLHSGQVYAREEEEKVIDFKKKQKKSPQNRGLFLTDQKSKFQHVSSL